MLKRKNLSEMTEKDLKRKIETKMFTSLREGLGCIRIAEYLQKKMSSDGNPPEDTGCIILLKTGQQCTVAGSGALFAEFLSTGDLKEYSSPVNKPVNFYDENFESAPYRVVKYDETYHKMPYDCRKSLVFDADLDHLFQKSQPQKGHKKLHKQQSTGNENVVECDSSENECEQEVHENLETIEVPNEIAGPLEISPQMVAEHIPTSEDSNRPISPDTSENSSDKPKPAIAECDPLKKPKKRGRKSKENLCKAKNPRLSDSTTSKVTSKTTRKAQVSHKSSEQDTTIEAYNTSVRTTQNSTDQELTEPSRAQYFHVGPEGSPRDMNEFSTLMQQVNALVAQARSQIHVVEANNVSLPSGSDAENVPQFQEDFSSISIPDILDMSIDLCSTYYAPNPSDVFILNTTLDE